MYYCMQRVETNAHSCLLNQVFTMTEVVLTTGLIASLSTDHHYVSGILEWVIAALGAFYILSFIPIVA